MRASGVMPSSRARVSLITITAAAPSLSGQALPAVTSPSGRNDRLELGQLLDRGARARAVVLVDDLGAVGQRQRGDLALEEPVLAGTATARCWDRAANSSISSRETSFELGDVLGGLAHRDVDVGQAVERRPRRLPPSPSASTDGPRPRSKRGLWVSGSAVGAALAEAADRLDAGGDEHVALAGLDRVRGHADGLQATTSSTG